MQYSFQLLPKEPLCTQLEQLRQQLTSLIGPNQALDYPSPHITLLHSIIDNGINAIQAGDALIATLPAVKAMPTITLPTKLQNRPSGQVILTTEDRPELVQLRETLFHEVKLLHEQGQLSVGPAEEMKPVVALAQEISPENQAMAREYITQNIDWLPDYMEFNQVVLVARDALFQQSYRIVARVILQPVDEPVAQA